MSQLDKVTGNITITKIRLATATNQIATSLAYHHCEIEESQGYGHAWIILENGAWLTGNNVTAAVPISTKSPAFTGTTSAEKYIFKAALKNYTDYKTHSNGAIKMIKHIFDESCFLDLEDDQGQMIGYTPHQIITHICDANVTEEGHDDEILEIEDRIRENYDPGEAPQVYFKRLQTCRHLFIQLQRDCPKQTLIRVAMKQFKLQCDLNDAVDEWTKVAKADKTWAKFKTFFSKEIKKNTNRGGMFKQIGLANAVMQQRLDTSQENQQILTANSIEQNNVIETLLTRIDKMETAAAAPAPAPTPALANAATSTDANAKMMETMMSMMSKMTTGGSGSGSGGNSGGNGGGGAGRNKRYQYNEKDKNRKGKTRRYDNDHYCWTSGFGIHTIVDAANHKKEATASNTMGGSQRNMHLRSTGT
jgi:hypothetical protein